MRRMISTSSGVGSAVTGTSPSDVHLEAGRLLHLLDGDPGVDAAQAHPARLLGEVHHAEVGDDQSRPALEPQPLAVAGAVARPMPERKSSVSTKTRGVWVVNQR